MATVPACGSIANLKTSEKVLFKYDVRAAAEFV
jgi:hypothetical protein